MNMLKTPENSSKKFSNDKVVKTYNVYSKSQEIKKYEQLIESYIYNYDYILSIPHSGQLIPIKYKDNYILGKNALIEIDMFSDLPYKTMDGMQVIFRLTPFVVDMNRKLKGANLPNIPLHLRNDPLNYITIKDKPILKKSLTFEEIDNILFYYKEYHRKLKKFIQIMKEKKGYALMIDCHSMTSVGLRNKTDFKKKRADFVIGTLNNTSADSRIIKAFEQALIRESKKYGYTVANGIPYSGGFITRTYGKPQKDIHVIQLEVSMKTYMYEGFIENKDLRYKIKPKKLKLINSIILKAINSATRKCKKIY